MPKSGWLYYPSTRYYMDEKLAKTGFLDQLRDLFNYLSILKRSTANYLPLTIISDLPPLYRVSLEWAIAINT